MNSPPKLFIPGPTQVAPEILRELARPAISHRGEDCAHLWRECRAGVARLLNSRGEIVLLTAPATALMEAGVRNLAARRSLHLVCGAFSKRWHAIGETCGREADSLEIEWGHGFAAEQVAEAVAGGDYEVLTIVHNETSTGVMNPVPEIAAAVRAVSPETLILVDAVSSMAGVAIDFDAWDIDLVLAGVQKALALPPGLAVAAISQRAMQRAESVPHRGWFLDFVRLAEFNRKEQSPTTPSTPHLYALLAQLERIFAEGLEARYARHRAMAERVRGWAERHGFGLFAQPGFRSETLSCIDRGEGPDFGPALKQLKQDGYLVSGGYGPLKGQTFRIAHMGELQMEDIEDLLARFDAALGVGAAGGPA